MPPSGARLTRHFSKAQREALLKAVCVDGMTVAEARRRARDGRLGVEPFDIGTYAYKYIERNREAYEKRDDDALRYAVAQEMRLAENDALAVLRNIRREAKDAGDAGDVDVEALAKASKALATIRASRRQADVMTKPGPETKPTRTNDGSNQTVGAGDVLATLLESAPNATSETTRQPNNPSANDAPNPSDGAGSKSGSLSISRNHAIPAASSPDRPTSSLV